MGETKQHELCFEVLRRFHAAGILDQMILIGSWCLLFYRDYFRETAYSPVIRTVDVDFLIPGLPITSKVDVAATLKELGFLVTFRGEAGYISLQHPDLAVEFLVPRKGGRAATPWPVFGINAQPVGYADMLLSNLIRVETEKFTLSVPHPANFTLHKLLISQLRKEERKRRLDLEQADYLIGTLKRIDKFDELTKVFQALPKTRQHKVHSALRLLGQPDLMTGAYPIQKEKKS